jgi:hypothetical protein
MAGPNQGFPAQEDTRDSSPRKTFEQMEEIRAATSSVGMYK